MNMIHKQRLLNVAKACRETKHASVFSMYFFGDEDCGTPACAMGNYAFRTDLQRTFLLRGADVIVKATGNDQRTWEDMQKHFGLTQYETLKLFDTDGCNNAKTPIQAAVYIEQFVVTKCMQ